MMVTYLLDTNTVSYIIKGRSPAARARLEALDNKHQVCISVITEAELRYGIAKRPAAHKLRAAVEAFLLKLRILPWASDEAAAYGTLRAQLEAAGTTLSEMDMLIAAQAIAQSAVMVTSDKAFLQVPALSQTVNWASDL